MLNAGAGNDVVTGGIGHETLLCGDGDDRIGNHIGPGTDTLNDVVDGGAGNDVLTLDYCASTLTGGSGADQFVFDYIQTGMFYWKVSTITDFESGTDQLHFHQIGLTVLPAGVLAANQLAPDQAVGKHAQFIQTHHAATDVTHLSFDQDGTDIHYAPDAVLAFAGHVTLTAADILIF